MKKISLLASLACMALGASLVSCSDSDSDFDSTETIVASEGNFEYNNDGVWTQNEKNLNFNIEDYIFSHITDEYGYVYGFTPSKVADTADHAPDFYTSPYPYASASGGGIKGAGSPYLVGYWGEYLEGSDCEFSKRTCRIYEEEGEEFQPQSVMVCNTTLMLYACLNGTDFTQKFEVGDWVTLTAHGVHLDGTTAEETIYLVNIEDNNNVKAGILTEWKKFDLRALGTCTGIYFTMDCSDRFKNGFGMTIPSYFCLDQLVVKD